MLPVVGLRESPFGNEGLIEKLLMSPPVETILLAVIAVPDTVVTDADV